MTINPIEMPYHGLCFRWYLVGLYCLPTAIVCCLFMLCPVCHILIQQDCRSILKGYYTADRLRFRYFSAKARKLTQLLSDTSEDVSNDQKFNTNVDNLKQNLMQVIETSADATINSINLTSNGMRLDRHIVKIILSYSHSDEYFKQTLQDKHKDKCLTEYNAIISKMNKIFIYSKILHKLNSMFCVVYCTFALMLQWFGLIAVFVAFGKWTVDIDKNSNNDHFNDWRKYQAFGSMFFSLFPTLKIITYFMSMMLFMQDTKSKCWSALTTLFDYDDVDFPYADADIISNRLGWDGKPLHLKKTLQCKRYSDFDYQRRRGYHRGYERRAAPNLCCIKKCEMLVMLGMLCGWFVNFLIPILLIFFPFFLVGFLPFITTLLVFIIMIMIFGCCVYYLFGRALIMNKKLLQSCFWQQTVFTVFMVMVMVVFGICVTETLVFGYFANEYFSIVCWYRGHEWSDCVVYAFQGQYCENDYLPFSQYFDDGDFNSIVIALALYL